MATTPSTPTGAATTDASEQMPDCIVASSNRFNDLLPFCNILYYAEPQKWGCILPWDFPQGASKEAEEEFLRKHFSETEIHMQGGAQGEGAGFRFLKQAWYSIAMWNYEHRIPSIATWWLESEENSSILKDPTMRDALCNEEVKPETCFNLRDIQMYGTPLLECVIKHIQERVKTKQAPPVEEPQTNDKPRSASNGNMAVDPVKAESVSVASPLIERNNGGIGDFKNRNPPRAASAIVPTNETATPFPIYEEHPQIKQQVRHSNHGHKAWSAGHPNHQVQGRKRGGRLSSAGSGTRGVGYDRASQEYQHHFHPSMFPFNGALIDGPASFGPPVPGPAVHPNQVTAMYPTMDSSFTGVLQAPPYDYFATRTPIPHARGPNFPSGEHYAQSSATPGMFMGGSTSRGHLAHRIDMERHPSDMSASSGFNNISAMSGDVRRSSFSSRGGGGLRGSNQLRGGKRGGGRGRDFSHQAPSVFEEGPYARKVSHEPYQKSNSNYGKRRGSAYQENTWRSGSEHPQVENTLPQRVLSGPNEYSVYQGFPSVAGSHLLPPFTFPPNQTGDRQNQAEHRRAPARLDHHQNVVPDFDVDERYIGSHATHVNELIVFNVPVHLTEAEVARDFSRTCDVEVVRVSFGKAVPGPEDATKVAFVQLPTHGIARRVLDLREVRFYDRPLSVLVPRKWHGQPSTPFTPSQHRHQLNASGGSFVPSGQFHLESHGYPRDSAPPPQFGLAAVAAHNITHPGGLPHPGLVSFPPATPYNAVKGEPGLSTVLSSNATPADSEPNTPRKKKNKKKKVAPPHATIAEHDDSGAPVDPTNTATPITTPSKNKHEKESLQDLSASNGTASKDPIAAREAKSSNTVLAANESKVTGKKTKDSQEPSDLSVQSLRVAAKAEHNGESLQTDEHKSDTTPTVSPRSLVPKGFPNQADVALDSKQPQGLATDKDLDVQHPSSPVSNKDRPAIVNGVSDSDHVDESFRTASASPLTDKRSQTKVVPTNGSTPPSTARSRKPTRLSNKRSISSQVKKIVNQADEHAHDADFDEATRHGSTSTLGVSPAKATSIDLQPTPTTPLPISVEAPTPPKKKSTNVLIDSKLPRSASNRSVSEPSSAQQKPFAVEASKSHDGPAEQARDSSLERSIPLAENEDDAEGNRLETLGAQDAASGTSIPLTPMTAYHTAPTTPASLETSASKNSAEKSSDQPKTPAKKGPSQTESFSMFGKKQQKQKKTVKGKGTLKGKPLELVNASNLSSENTSQGVSGTATPLNAVASTSNKKLVLTVKTETDSNTPTSNAVVSKSGSTSGEVVCSEEAVTATSGQESPSKGGLRNLIGGFFSRVKSPIVSGTKKSLEDVPSGDGLMESKAPAEAPQTMFNLDHIVQQRTFDDERTHGDKSVFTTDINTRFNDANDHDTSGMSVTGLGILASSSADLKETPKKKRKKKNKRLGQQGESQRGGSPEANEDDDNAESIATPSTRTDATNDSFDVGSDNNSDKSSTTMGRHTPSESPKALTPSNKKLFEQRKTGNRIISSPPPRNINKKRPHIRAPSSATASSAQETPGPAAAVPSEIELGQQKRVLQLFRMPSSDDSTDSHDTATPPARYIFSNIMDDEGNTQQVILTLKCIIQTSNGSRLNVHGLGDGSDDDVVLSVQGKDTAEEDEWRDRGD
ncbi:hypothetical protein Q7P35_006167 [Cladosporium inversicolor]